MVVNLGTCSECGEAVPSDARTLGLCPRCLMRSALVGSGGERIGRQPMEAPGASVLCEALGGLEVLELIGRGGMGFVYQARQRSLDRLVAVKLFPREAYEDPSFAERFANEARILASLSHPNIVAAYEFGETERYCHLVMELIGGRSLRQRMEERPVGYRDAIEIARQVCLALEYAHSRGVIHRDVKPENILLEEAAEGAIRVRVADFGLAKLVERRPTDFSMTAPNRLMGTPDYMAPEQRARPGEVDARADVYALGVVMYEMLAGQLPLGRFAPPTTDAATNRVVMRCLATRPEDRYASVAEVRRELEGLGVRQQQHWWLAIAGVAAAVVVAVGVGIWRWPKGPPSGVAVTSQPAPRMVVTTKPGREMAVVPLDRAWPGVRAPGQFGGGGVGMMERVLADYPAERVVRVMVDDMPAGLRGYVVDRLGDLAGAASRSSSGNERSVTVVLAPVRDVEAFAKKIDFGKVVKVDAGQRVIEVVCDDPKKLPTPLPPAVKTPTDPKFYTQNLADLTCWDKRRREEALERLGKAEPKELKAEIAAAMTKLAADPEAGVRKAAVAALGGWCGVEAIPTLSAALADEDVWVRKAAMGALGEIKDARAAEAVAGVMGTQRHEGAAALRRIGPAAEDVAIGLLKHADGWVRMEAAKVLEEIGSAKSLPALGQAAKGRDGLVRMAAERAVTAIKERAK